MQTAFSGAHTLSFAYDQLSRNTSATRVADGATHVVNYQYDLAGRRTRVTWPDSFYAQYDYDLTGAVTAIRENGASSGVGVLAVYAYDNLGRRVSVTRGNSVVTAYDYDAASRLEELSHQLNGSSADQTLTFTYNAAGQALSRAGANSAYDWPQPALGYANYVPNGLNQYNTVAAASIVYDARGNLTSDGTTTYGYDLYNRLTGAGSASFAYDPAGRLYQSAGAATARFQYDGLDLIAEYNASNVLQRRYVHGPSFDEPVVWYEGSGASDRRWLVQDQLGSVIAVTDASGTALAINSYDEYGRPAAANQGRFQYTGQTWLSDASLYHYKARAYSPVLGRFMQTDPILYAGGMNLYAYVGGDPVNFIDPSGLRIRCWAVGQSVDTEGNGVVGTVRRECAWSPDFNPFDTIGTLIGLTRAPSPAPGPDLGGLNPSSANFCAASREKIEDINATLAMNSLPMDLVNRGGQPFQAIASGGAALSTFFLVPGQAPGERLQMQVGSMTATAGAWNAAFGSPDSGAGAMFGDIQQTLERRRENLEAARQGRC